MAIPDREVRRLLRSIRKPKRLETLPLAQAIRDQLKAESSQAAILQFLRDAFAPYGEEGRRLHDLLRRADIESSETHVVIARSMNLSARHFYRHRSEAVHILVRALQELFSKPGEGPASEALALSLESIDPVVAAELYGMNAMQPNELRNAIMTRLRAKTALFLELRGESGKAENIARCIRQELRFRNHEYRHEVLSELAYRDFIIASYRSNSKAAFAAVRDVRANASANQRTEILAGISESVAALQFDDAASALEALRGVVSLARGSGDAFLLATAVLKLGEALLSSGKVEEAYGLLDALELASQALPFISDEVRTLRNRLALQDPSIVPAPFDGVIHSHDRAMFAATWSRHLFQNGEAASARNLAREVIAFATPRDYLGPRVWALGTLGEVEQAWKLTASSGDRGIAYDALIVPLLEPKIATQLLNDPSYAKALESGLASQLLSPFDSQTQGSGAFASSVLRFTAMGELCDGQLTTLAAYLGAEGITAQHLARYRSALTAFIKSLYTASWPVAERAECGAQAGARVEAFITLISARLREKNSELHAVRHHAG